MMNSYDKEKRELFEWLKKEHEEYYAAVKIKMENGTLARDSMEGLKYQMAVREYNRKLLELKRKYNIP